MARQDYAPAKSASRNDTYFALSGLILRLVPQPRASPWAITCGPFRATCRHRVIDGLTVTTQTNTAALCIVIGEGLDSLVPLSESGNDSELCHLERYSSSTVSASGRLALPKPSLKCPGRS